MKVLMSRFAQTYGGAERSFVTNARALEACGVSVYALSQQPDILKSLKNHGIQYSKVHFLSKKVMKNPILFLLLGLPLFSLQLIYRLLTQQPDLIYAHSRIDQVFWSKTKFLHRRPVFWKDPSDLAWSLEVDPTSLYSRLHISSLKNCDGLYVLSASYLKRLEIALPGNAKLPDNLIVAPSGIIPDDYHPQSRTDNNAIPVLLSVGRLHEKKGFMALLEAATHLSAYDFKLVIAGEGEERERLTTLRDKLGLEQRVEFVGQIEKIDDLLNSSDIFVSAAEVEPWGLAISEARLFGKAIVATPTEGTLDQLKPDKTAIITGGFSPADIATGIDRLLAEPELRKKLGRTARKDVSNVDFTKTMKQKILPGFERALRSRS